jgi:hypothetical protein
MDQHMGETWENWKKKYCQLKLMFGLWILSEFYWLKGPSFLAEWGQFGRCTRHFFWNSFIVKWTCSIISLFRLRIQPHELSFDHPKIRFEAPKAAPLLANIKLRADLSSSFCETLWVNIIFYPTLGGLWWLNLTSQSGECWPPNNGEIWGDSPAEANTRDTTCVWIKK